MRATRFTTPHRYRFLREGRGEILVRKGYEVRLRRAGLLAPSRLWEIPHLPSRVSGRGEVLITRCGRNSVAVRKYRHGGLLRGLTGDLFFFGSRPLRELVATEKARAAGVPTLEILAAIKEPVWGGCYRAYLITAFLPSAIDMISYLEQSPRDHRRKAVIEKAAAAVKTMHKGGIYHADLHLKNFLVDEAKRPVVYVIDFDKSGIARHLNPRDRMKNLMRLDRSVEKLKRHGLRITDTEKQIFCHTYEAGSAEISSAIKTFKKRYHRHAVRYRLGWWLARVFYPGHKPWRKSRT
jgi:tRNA A-37 threonylcarbamoyl transferase component Bud32